jgi:DNA-binding LytR/AlgR family response regulator
MGIAKSISKQLLTEQNFFRIHNSDLINLDCIKSYNKGKGGSVVLNDGTELEVSTRRKDDFLKKCHCYKGVTAVVAASSPYISGMNY